SSERGAPRVEPLGQRLGHRVAVGRPAGLDHHGRCAVGELRRKGPLREVEAYADDHCNGGRGAGTRRGWRAVGTTWLRTANARRVTGAQGAGTRRGWRAVGTAWLRTANARRVTVARRWSSDSRLHQDSRQLPTTHADVVRPL